jgi:sigma-54 dependent transcriptional regulator, acetoin dehydrogenase operon transcriptional activator AcoR
MPVPISITPAGAGSDRLAAARERFLTAGVAEPEGERGVRGTILASWGRSRGWRVPADRIDVAYLGDPDLDTPLTRSALPVLRKLRENLEGQPISIILTDPSGLVLARMRAHADLDRHLDSVRLAPGFSYAEKSVGTNGIGTALEGGCPAHVFGHEHYAENLEDLACAGVPIRHPISGSTVGLIDLTCWRRDADPLLIALSRTTADQITHALLSDSSGREMGLMREYRRACRHSAGMVLGLSNDMVMTNDQARQVLDPGDQVVLVGEAAEALASRRPTAIDVDLPTGARARVHCRPVRSEDASAGGIVHVRLIQPGGSQAAGVAGRPRASRAMTLPGLVGSGSLWLRACQEAEAVRDGGEWLALEGEPGVGKLALLRALHQRRNPAGHFRVLDAADAGGEEWLAQTRRELLEAEGDLVIRHVARLGTRHRRALSVMLADARAAGRQRVLWVAMTQCQPAQCQPAHGQPAQCQPAVQQSFPRSVEVPPLRHHIDDLHELVPFFLARLGREGQLSCSPEAMQLLLRSGWPGNVEQVWQVLRNVVRRRRSGSVQPQDLPPECWAVSRRLLSPLESIERDAITEGLLHAKGNKAQAAQQLGMSRATIYRKIHEYGIVAPVG